MINFFLYGLLFFLMGVYGGFIQAGIDYLVISLPKQLHYFSSAKNTI